MVQRPLEIEKQRPKDQVQLKFFDCDWGKEKAYLDSKYWGFGSRFKFGALREIFLLTNLNH